MILSDVDDRQTANAYLKETRPTRENILALLDHVYRQGAEGMSSYVEGKIDIDWSPYEKHKSIKPDHSKSAPDEEHTWTEAQVDTISIYGGAGERPVLGLWCRTCGAKRPYTEEQLAERAERERQKVIDHNKAMEEVQRLKDLQAQIEKDRQEALDLSYRMFPETCVYCGGKRWITDESACTDPDCCGDSGYYPCRVCNPDGAAEESR
jgi:hypothetical protein